MYNLNSSLALISHFDDFLCRIDRRASRDMNINGLYIPSGCVVNVPIYAMHHNPEVWPEPDKFKPERY